MHKDSYSGTMYQPGYVLGYHGIQAVKEVSFGHAEEGKREKQLWPATVWEVTEIPRLAIECYDLLHVGSYLLL